MQWSAISLVITLFILSACGQVATPFEKSPSDVVKTFYQTANEGKYSDAVLLLSEGERAAMQRLGVGLKHHLDKNTRNGTIKDVQILSEVIRGEGATVIARISYQDGSTNTNDQTNLIKEKGSWKITP